MNLVEWLEGKHRLIWLQPDALLADISVEDMDAIIVPSQVDGVVFIWDLPRLQSLGYGESRLAFLYQALQELAKIVGNKFLLINGISEEVLVFLQQTPVVLQTQATATTHDLQALTVALSAKDSVFVYWHPVKQWISYPQPLPNGFFKFWKAAEKQLFAQSVSQQASSAFVEAAKKHSQSRPHRHE